MLHLFDPLRNLNFISLLTQLLLAVFCGAAIGLERSAKNRPAGFRTHILVCLGGAVAAATGHFIYLGLGLPADVTRLSGQIITGLGFIGVGTIIVTKTMTVKGLTTAAGLWTTGIIGISLGSGFYEGGLLGTALVLIAEIVFSRYSIHPKKRAEFAVEILYNEKDSLDAVMRFCKNRHASIKNLQIHSEDSETAKYTAILRIRDYEKKDQLISEISVMPGIVSATEL